MIGAMQVEDVERLMRSRYEELDLAEERGIRNLELELNLGFEHELDLGPTDDDLAHLDEDVNAFILKMDRQEGFNDFNDAA